MITSLTHADIKCRTTLSSFMHLLALKCSLFGFLIWNKKCSDLKSLKIESCWKPALVWALSSATHSATPSARRSHAKVTATAGTAVALLSNIDGHVTKAMPCSSRSLHTQKRHHTARVQRSDVRSFLWMLTDTILISPLLCSFLCLYSFFFSFSFFCFSFFSLTQGFSV